MTLDNNKENVSNAPLPSYTLQNLQDDFSKQYTTLNQSVSTIWNIQFACDKYIEVSMYDKKLIDCRQVFRTVKVSTDLTWEAAYGGHKASTINAKTLWNKYQITLHCCIFDPPCPPFNVEAKKYDTKCCIQNQQHCLGWGRDGTALSKQLSKNCVTCRLRSNCPKQFCHSL